MEIISKQRNAIMGIATILIMVFHTSITMTGIADVVKNWCDFGVNIFFLMSGFSMYYSWMKQPVTAIFIKKRLLKIGLTFCPVVIVWCFPQVLIGRIGLAEFIEKTLSIRFWIDGNLLYWFISGIVLLYLITPAWMKIFEKDSKMCWVATSIIVIIVFWAAMLGPLKHVRIFVYRMPSYFIGIYFADMNKRKRNSKFIYICSGIMGVTGIALTVVMKVYEWEFLSRYFVYLLLVPIVVELLAVLLDKINGKYFGKGLAFMGMISLETYLMQERVQFILQAVINKMGLISRTVNLLVGLVAIVMTIIAAYLWHRIVEWISGKICEKKGK